ncbi:MAG: ATP-binding protein [Pseudomonadota bacterium]
MTSLAIRDSGLPLLLQVAALLVVAQLVGLAVSVAVVSVSIGRFEEPFPNSIAREVLAPQTTALGIANQVEPTQRSAVLDAAIRFDDRLGLESSFEPVSEANLERLGRGYLAVLRQELPEIAPERVALAENGTGWAWPPTIGDYKIGIELAPDQWLTFSPSTGTPTRSLPYIFMGLTALLISLPLIGLSIWTGSALIAPLRRLATAARRFSRDLEAEPARVSGPAEVRTVARTFNAMREQLKSLLDARTHTLAAIGHDLRTPLTRMRLRIESLDDSEAQAKLLDDVRSMEAMVNSALGYLRGQQRELSYQRFDLAALVQTICDETANDERGLSYLGPDRLTVIADADQIDRAIVNLVVNAVKYAGSAVVELEADQAKNTLRLTVSDSGPGMSDQEHQALFEPFRRGDPARGSEDAAGFGLGLSIARDIVERHQGSIRLRHNLPRGLRVEIELPLQPSGEDSVAKCEDHDLSLAGGAKP